MTQNNQVIDNSINENAPLHLVISSMRGTVWIKPSRPCNRIMLLGMMMDAVFMLQTSTAQTVRPEDCRLRVLLTVDDEQDDPS